MSTELARGRSSTGAPTRARVLVVADADGTPELAAALQGQGHEVVVCGTVEAGCAALAEARPDLVFVATAMAETIATTAQDLDTPVIEICADGRSGPQATGCVGRLSSEAVAGSAGLIVGLLLEREQLQRQNQQLDGIVQGVRDGSALVGRSPVMRRLQSALSRAAESEATVLLEGAPGTGKSVSARVIHCKSRRGNRQLVSCAAAELDNEAIQKAFTDARGTTLLIEDVEQLSLQGQQALVRFLKERSPAGAGGDGAPARLIATTSTHLPELVARGAFREDLYYRLHAYPIVVPSLRERVEDIALLAESLLNQIASTHSQKPAGLTPSGRIMLESMPWPGNVAQLESVVRRAFIAAAGAPIDDRHLLQPATAAVAQPATAAAEAEENPDLTEDAIRPFDEEEQRLLSRALRATRGNVRRAAQLLGIGRATLYRKIQQYKLRLQ